MHCYELATVWGFSGFLWDHSRVAEAKYAHLDGNNYD